MKRVPGDAAHRRRRTAVARPIGDPLDFTCLPRERLPAGMSGLEGAILLVDDDPVERQRIRFVLEGAGYRVEAARTGAEALPLLARGGFDAVVLDIDLPGTRGGDVLHAISDMRGARGVPVLAITGLDSQAVIESAFELGAYDFISKPIDDAVLLQRVRWMMLARANQGKLVATDRPLSKVAENKTVHDDLTGFYNRPHFMKCLEAAIAKASTDPRYTFSVLHLDLDHFKFVNDHLGHRTGDRILRDLARRFEPLVGARDTFARLGGDDFALLIDAPDDAEETVKVAGRLLMEIESKPLTRTDDMMLAASIGIVRWEPGMGDAEAVMRDAEIALESSRRIRSGTYAIFNPEMLAEAEAAQLIRNDLYGAVERGELRLFYQPLVDIATCTIYGFEGLVRWQHPVRGLVEPTEFIPTSEETGLIVELGRWVLIEGCRAASELQRAAGRPLTMSLNVSSQQLLHRDFLAHLREAIATSGVDPGTLQLEITESVFLAGSALIGGLFAHIRALGIKIALDDFGTGYSSLSYLERFQIDALKIDKSFVDRVQDASGKSEVLRMIVALAHALGVDVIAEGIETREQRDALGRLGCTHLQGFLFGPPVPKAAALRMSVTHPGDGTELAKLLAETLTDTGVAALSEEQRGELRAQVESTISMHYLWIERIRAAVASGSSPLDPALVAREDLCPIGVWLNSTISATLRTMPLYYVTKSRHAVFHRSMARVLAAALAHQPDAALSIRPDGDFTMVATSLLRTLRDWLAVATADAPHAVAVKS
jgi:diguanylate cyclase (GGDEF)-like protein